VSLAASLAGSLAGWRTPPDILGVNLVEWWDARYGVTEPVAGEASVWTGLVQSIPLTAPVAANRMLYAADGSNFRGQKVLKSSATGPRFLQNAAVSPTPFAAGTRPYLLGVLRVGTHAASNRWVFRSLSADSSEGGPDFLLQNAGADLNNALGHVTTFGAATTVVTLEAFIDAAADPSLSINGTDTATAGTVSIGLARTQLSVGAHLSGSAPIDVFHAAYVLCAALPTAEQRRALRAWAKAQWGAP
jgi:hypothetical protein